MIMSGCIIILSCPLNYSSVFNVITLSLQLSPETALQREDGGTAGQESAQRIFADHPFGHMFCVAVILDFKIYTKTRTRGQH